MSKAQTQEQLKQHLSTRTAAPPAGAVVNKTGTDIAHLLKINEAEIFRACGDIMRSTQFSRTALTTIKLSPGLLACSASSLMGGFMQSVQLKLSVDPTLGQAYLVPFNRKIKVPQPDGSTREVWSKEAQFIIGYRGYIKLILNSGEVSKLMAHPVYLNDKFELEYGLDEKLIHVPWFVRRDVDPAHKEGGIFIGAYAVARFKDGGTAHLFMPKSEIDDHRSRSMSKDSGPWVTDYISMCLKTVVRTFAKWLPMSTDDMTALKNDESVKQIDFAPGNITGAIDMNNVQDELAVNHDINLGQDDYKVKPEETAVVEVAPEVKPKPVDKPVTKPPPERKTAQVAEEAPAAEVATVAQVSAQDAEFENLLTTINGLLKDVQESTGEFPDDIIDRITNNVVTAVVDLTKQKPNSLEKIIKLLTADLVPDSE